MTSVGVRELRARLSHYLERVRQGERIAVTDRGREIAVLTPAEESELNRRLWKMVEEGKASWDGGKPDFQEPIRAPGRPLSEIVLEERG